MFFYIYYFDLFIMFFALLDEFMNFQIGFDQNIINIIINLLKILLILSVFFIQEFYLYIPVLGTINFIMSCA